MTFESLGLSRALSQRAAALGLVTPTPIQQQAVPVVLAGHDLLATAPTGNGKTAAYLLPLLHHLEQHPPSTPARQRRRPTVALVLVPTRELAQQVASLFDGLLPASAPPRLVVAVGGVSINPQMMALRGGAEVVVATPGRLLDLVRHNALRLDQVEYCVLDEADRLLELGFADELQTILAQLTARRQMLMFSATFAPALQAMAEGLMHEPVRVDIPHVEPAMAPAIQQRAILVDHARRTTVLRQLLEQQDGAQALVFVASQYAAEQLASKLHRGDRYATAFHGGLSQGARERILQEFKDGRWDVVVTTDLAARGLHIEDLPLVVNYDLPRSPTDHTHRMGRTGRAGAQGLALSLVTPATQHHWQLICKRLRQTVPLEQLPGHEPTETAPEPSAGTGGIKGRRPSKKDKLRAAAAAAAQAESDTAPRSADGSPDTRA